MPKYTKFLEYFLTNKGKLEEIGTVALNGDCSAILDKKLSKKFRDPGSFVIPCLLGDGVEEHALEYSGANINVIPYTIYLKLRLGELWLAWMNL